MSAEERGSGTSGQARTHLPTAMQQGMATRQHLKTKGKAVWRNQTSQLSNGASMGKPLMSLALVLCIWKMGKTVSTIRDASMIYIREDLQRASRNRARHRVCTP